MTRTLCPANFTASAWIAALLLSGLISTPFFDVTASKTSGDESSCKAQGVDEDGIISTGSCAATDDDVVNDNNDRATTTELLVDHGKRQIDWIRSKGGFVHEYFEIRQADPFDTNSYLGVFAKGDIRKSEILLDIPRECMIIGEVNDDCDTARILVQEMKLSPGESQWEPYIDYLKTQMYPQLPSLWSDTGKALFQKMIGGSIEDPLLPPAYATPSSFIDCNLFSDVPSATQEDRQLELHASMLLTQRGWDEIMIPVFDMLNHRNGEHWTNTDSTSVHQHENGVTVKATRDITKGEEIYTSYTHCRDCEARRSSYGTSELVRDYGFVEMFPQKWVFMDQGVSFILDQKYDGNDSVDVDGSGQDRDGIVFRLENRPRDHDLLSDALEFFQEQLHRLEQVETEDLTYHTRQLLPEREWALIMDYYNALTLAIKIFINKIFEEGEPCVVGESDGKSCRPSVLRYDKFSRMPIDTAELLRPYSCDTEVSMDFSHYKELDAVQSLYQNITFFQNPEDRDTCFDLDDTYQICSSYRPQYHEMMVHYVARFLPRVERVLFVGGGDSMLLHEILKYETLDIVIGLELDQKVTRLSFKHFGSQPHWDNEKVQWWFGDAAKSLLMLPKSYFGTFDMVLVDLSETVMSNAVTKDLDILSALSLLLKHDGIFVKNELYLEEMSELFTYTSQVHFYGVPVICSQTLILGSNGIDFAKTTIKDHGVHTLLGALDNIQEHNKFVHSYIHNPFAQKHCKKDNDNTDPEYQESSPGIVMILEAENVSAELYPAKHVTHLIVSTIQNEGFSVLSTSASDMEQNGSIIVIVLDIGYIVARTAPSYNYCAFDIHLWSSFQKLETLKRSLLIAIRTKDPPSDFRVVAGGMFGVSTWKKDEISRGPTFTQRCHEDTRKPVAGTHIDQRTLRAIVSTSLDLVRENSTTAIIICGFKDKPCDSLEVDGSKVFTDVIPIWACPSLKGKYSILDGVNHKYECEKEITATLIGVTEGTKVGTIVLDPSSHVEMAQIIYKIMSRDLKVVPKSQLSIESIKKTVGRSQMKSRIFSNHLLAVVPMLKPRESWRKIFLHMLGMLYLQEPAIRSSVLFNGTESYTEVCIFKTGDYFFLEHLTEVAMKVESLTGLVSDIRSIEGGYPAYQHDFVPAEFFSPGDYDQHSPLEQWSIQHPWGHQTIFQIEFSESRATPSLSKEVIRKLLDTVLSKLNTGTVSPVQEFCDIGDGSLITAVIPEGNVIFLWDGRNHIDVNLFTFEENFEFVDEFSKCVVKGYPGLKVALQDEMPRGFGHVVNFRRDLAHDSVPPWGLGTELDTQT